MVKGMAKNFPAPAKCVDAVEAAVKRRFDDGMVYERELFTALMFTPECKALRHAFFGERAASKIPDVPEDTPQRADRQGGRHRRRHHGRRHQHELPQRRHPGDDAGDEAGRAGPRRGDDPQELREPGQEGQAQAGQARRAHGAAEHDAGLRRHRRRRPGDRGRVRGDGRQGKGLQDARRGDEARRHPGHQHLHAGRRPDRGVHQAAAGRGRHALLQPRQRDEAAGGGARREDRPRTCWPP